MTKEKPPGDRGNQEKEKSEQTCPVCHGAGKLKKTVNDLKKAETDLKKAETDLKKAETVWVQCKRCAGTGTVLK
jgi:RecJ-like exonuclease